MLLTPRLSTLFDDLPILATSPTWLATWNNNGQEAVRPQWRSAPALLQEREDAYFLRIEMPGIKRESLDIEAKDGQLTVRGTHAGFEFGSTGDKEGSLSEAESFSRVFTVPKTIDVDKADAKYVDGILTVTLPKAAVAKPYKIAVKAA